MTMSPSPVWPLNSSGSVEPPPQWATRRRVERPSYGAAIARIAELMGKPRMGWQRIVDEVATEVLPSGEWAYPEVIVTTQRRAGKTTLLRPVMVHRCNAAPGRRVWMTAQDRRRAVRRWMDVRAEIVDGPLGSMIRRNVIAASNEILEWQNRSTLIPFSPNGSSMHSEESDLVTVDEFWRFDAAQAAELVQAYQPTLLTTDGQVWLTSTAGDEHSSWFAEAQQRGRQAVVADTGEGTAYFEWSLPADIDTGAMGDDEILQACYDWHPAKGHTIKLRAMRAAQEQMSRGDFVRAYGNIFQPSTRLNRLIRADAYQATEIDVSIPRHARIAIGIDCAPDREASAVLIGRRGKDGIGTVEVARAEPGTRWVAPYVRLLKAKTRCVAVGVDGYGPARDIADDLERGGMELLRLKTGDFAAASTQFCDELNADQPTIRHVASVAMDEARDHIDRRRFRDGWAFARNEYTAPLVGAAVVMWAWDHQTEPEEPLGPFRIG